MSRRSRGPSDPNTLTMVLAGGAGERLRPLTLRRCKPAMPFGATFRVIDFTLMNCSASGLREVYVLTQHMAGSLDLHCRERYQQAGLDDFVRTRSSGGPGIYRGTADAVWKNIDLVSGEHDAVLVLSGDHVYHANYQEFVKRHLELDADVSVLVGSVTVDEASRYGVVQTAADGRIVRFAEKPTAPHPFSRDGDCTINLGVYCFRPDFLRERLLLDSRLPTSSHDFGKDILPASAIAGSVHACPFALASSSPYWRDVGTIDSFFETSMDVARGRFSLADPAWPPGAPFRRWLPQRLGLNILSSEAVVEDAILDECIVSPGVRVEDGCHLESCILFPGAHIAKATRLRRVIVEEGVSVSPATEVGFNGTQIPVSAGGVTVITESVGGGSIRVPSPAAESVASA